MAHQSITPLELSASAVHTHIPYHKPKELSIRSFPSTSLTPFPLPLHFPPPPPPTQHTETHRQPQQQNNHEAVLRADGRGHGRRGVGRGRANVWGRPAGDALPRGLLLRLQPGRVWGAQRDRAQGPGRPVQAQARDVCPGDRHGVWLRRCDLQQRLRGQPQGRLGAGQGRVYRQARGRVGGQLAPQGGHRLHHGLRRARRHPVRRGLRVHLRGGQYVRGGGGLWALRDHQGHDVHGTCFPRGGWLSFLASSNQPAPFFLFSNDP